MNRYDVSLIYHDGRNVTIPYLKTGVVAENKEDAAQRAKEEFADIICVNTKKSRERVMKRIAANCVVEAIYSFVYVDACEVMRG